MATKVSHAKSAQFLRWKEQHMHEAHTIQGTALDKFREKAAERARKHDDIDTNN